MNYLLQCSMTIGVVVLLPFLGVSSLNFGPLATAAFFLAGVLRPKRESGLTACLFPGFGTTLMGARLQRRVRDAAPARQSGEQS
jgi:hypothetical protein